MFMKLAHGSSFKNVFQNYLVVIKMFNIKVLAIMSFLFLYTYIYEY